MHRRSCLLKQSCRGQPVTDSQRALQILAETAESPEGYRQGWVLAPPAASLAAQWCHRPASAGHVGVIPGLGRSHLPGGNQAHAQLLSRNRWSPQPQGLCPPAEPLQREAGALRLGSSPAGHTREKPTQPGTAQPNVYARTHTHTRTHAPIWSLKLHTRQGGRDTQPDAPRHQADTGALVGLLNGSRGRRRNVTGDKKGNERPCGFSFLLIFNITPMFSIGQAPPARGHPLLDVDPRGPATQNFRADGKVEDCVWDKGAQRHSLVRRALPAAPSTQERQNPQGWRQRRSQLFSSSILPTPSSPLHAKPLLRASDLCNIQQAVKSALSLTWPTLSPSPSLCASLKPNWISQSFGWSRK